MYLESETLWRCPHCASSWPSRARREGGADPAGGVTEDTGQRGDPT